MAGEGKRGNCHIRWKSMFQELQEIQHNWSTVGKVGKVHSKDLNFWIRNEKQAQISSRVTWRHVRFLRAYSQNQWRPRCCHRLTFPPCTPPPHAGSQNSKGSIIHTCYAPLVTYASDATSHLTLWHLYDKGTHSWRNWASCSNDTEFPKWWTAPNPTLDSKNPFHDATHNSYPALHLPVPSILPVL